MKRAKLVRRFDHSSGTPSKATYLVLLVELGEFKYRCETWTLKNKYIFGLAAEARKLRETVAKLEEVDASVKNISIGHGKKRTSAA